MKQDLVRTLDELQHRELEIRLSAAAALEATVRQGLSNGCTVWEPFATQALHPLIKALGDPYKGVQVHSAQTLELLHPYCPAIMPALRATLSGIDPWQAWGAALVTARLGEWFPELGPALTGAMGARDRDVRWAAAHLSLQLGRSRPEAVAMVKSCLQSENPLARKMAAYCLGSMGQYADVEAALAARLEDPERDVRRAALLAIDKLPLISSPVSLKIAALRADPDLFVRRTAAAVAAKKRSADRSF